MPFAHIPIGLMILDEITVMNVYSCTYKKSQGYCCRRHDTTWMFVPQFGEPDRHIYKKVPFEDLEFSIPEEKIFEAIFENRLRQSGLTRQFKNLFKKDGARTVGGKLFCPISI